MTSLKALDMLYNTDHHISQLGGFTARFYVRIREMVNDADDDVAVAAINVVTKLCIRGALTKNEIKSVAHLVLDRSAQVRHAAANVISLVYLDVSARVTESDAQQKHDSAGRGKLCFGKGLVEVLQAVDEHGDNKKCMKKITNAMWEVSPDILQNWDVMAKRLLDDDLELYEATCLACLMNSIVHQLQISQSDGRHNSLNHTTIHHSDKARVQDLFTTSMMKHLLPIIQKYQVRESTKSAHLHLYILSITMLWSVILSIEKLFDLSTTNDTFIWLCSRLKLRWWHHWLR